MPSIQTYGQFLAFLLSLGPALQKIWPALQALVAAYSAFSAVVKEAFGPSAPEVPADGALQLNAADNPLVVDGVVLSAGMMEQEAKVAALIAGPTAVFDGSILRSAWKFTKEHPELVSLLVSLLHGGS